MEDFEFIGLDSASNRVHSVHQRTKLKAPKKKFEVLDVWEFHAEGDTPDIRRIELYRASREYFATLEILSPRCHIFAEEPITGRNGKTNRLLALAAGAIWAAHLDFNVIFHWVDISHWKKQVIGKGNAKKDDVRAWSRKHGGKKKWEEDHHDAHAIGVSGAIDLSNLDSTS